MAATFAAYQGLAINSNGTLTIAEFLVLVPKLRGKVAESLSTTLEQECQGRESSVTLQEQQ